LKRANLNCHIKKNHGGRNYSETQIVAIIKQYVGARKLWMFAVNVAFRKRRCLTGAKKPLSKVPKNEIKIN